jgi:hypothetical protein
MSFSMKQAMQFSFEGEGKDNGIPGASGVDPPTARVSVSPTGTVTASTTVTLDASGSTDNGKLMYFAWEIDTGEKGFQLYGEVVRYTFYANGSYDIHLMVVDDEWNMNETLAHIEVTRATADDEPPMVSSPPMPFNINAGETLELNGSIATDNVAVVNWTWYIQDVQEKVLYGEMQSYRFDYVGGEFGINLVARDAAGNTGKTWASVNVQAMTDDGDKPRAIVDIPTSARIGDRIELSGGNSQDNQGISSYVWYVTHNSSVTRYTGESVSFTAAEFGPYEVKLIVKDSSGNYGTAEGMVIATPEGMDFSLLGWTSTPFDIDLSFNLLTYSYGIALLASVVFVGGLFAKGFTHEITKGTVKVLFFGPISVTTMIFSKILYPLVLGPIFIFPVVFIGLSQFDQPTADVLKITLVSYLMAAITMVSAAYGSCLIYIAAKKMVLKPSVISRMFLYFSLLGTLTVFEWLSFVLDQWQKTTSWDALYHDYAWVAVLSPFHQGGMFLSNSLIGTHWALDLWVFIIPAVLIIGGALASSKLYGDIFARE